MKCPREFLESGVNSHVKEEVVESQVAPSWREVDFSEYEWMGEEMEAFDKQCLDEFLEEDFIEACFEDMLSEEEEVSWMLGNLSPEDRQSLVDILASLSLSEGENSQIPQIFLVDDASSDDGDPRSEEKSDGR